MKTFDPGLKQFEGACPSIRYRMLSEVVGQPASGQGMAGLQSQILRDPLVGNVMKWQQADGWLAWDFHGSKSIESGIRILCEKGVPGRHPVVAKALKALEQHTERLERGLGRPGTILDEQGLGGARMIRATIFAYAGVEDRPFVQEQIDVALTGFQAVLAINSIDELAENYRDKLVFRPGVRWPGIYHLRLLAFTHGWRTAEKQKRIAEAVRRLVELSPLPSILVRHKSQFISPASFCMQEFNPDMNKLDDAHWMMWFHRMECLARLGIIKFVPELRKQVNTLADLLDADGLFTKKLSHPYFSRWGSYSGLMLEDGWRSPIRRIYDLTFRSRLILHYAGGTPIH